MPSSRREIGHCVRVCVVILTSEEEEEEKEEETGGKKGRWKCWQASRGQGSNGFSWSLSFSPHTYTRHKRKKRKELVTNSMMIAQSARVSRRPITATAAAAAAQSKPSKAFFPLYSTHTHTENIQRTVCSLLLVLVCFVCFGISISISSGSSSGGGVNNATRVTAHHHRRVPLQQQQQLRL